MLGTSFAAPPAFTIVELLVVISIIGVLVGLLLPAVTSARDTSLVSKSEANLRQLGTAHETYASEWNDRQFTLTVDNIASYGLSDGTPGAIGSVEHYREVQGKWPPPVELGWGVDIFGQSEKRLWMLRIDNDPSEPQPKKNYALLEPIAFRGAWGNANDDIDRMGYFRIPNARQFTQYLDGRFFNPIFYAPKDTIVYDMVQDAFNTPDEYPDPKDILDTEFGWDESQHFAYSSYSRSPAGLFSPDVLRNPGEGGWQDPWQMPAGFRAPSRSQARYSSLKTQMLEHHWLQNRRVSCNDLVPENNEAAGSQPYVISGGQSCQPHFFNQALESTPVTLFYDGHVAKMDVSQAMRADARMSTQSGNPAWGLWSRDTPFGDDGYFIDRSWDQAATSFHILTTDGILGRDKLSDG